MQYQSLELENYRGFKRLSIEGLSCVNLLVGTNNSGKTSVLEAIQSLAATDNPRTLWSPLSRRGERTRSADDGVAWDADVCHLFHGHVSRKGAEFYISASKSGEKGHSILKAEITDRNKRPTVQRTFLGDGTFEESYPDDDEMEDAGTLALAVSWNRGETLEIPINNRGSTNWRALSRLIPPRRQLQPVRFVTTAALGFHEVHSLWERVQLQPEEELVYNALQLIDPRIERIAPVGAHERVAHRQLPHERGGFIVRLKGNDYPIPIGSMGDGVWRLLGLSLALVESKDGILLVDEIDTGLHYTVMETMWKLVYDTASKLNVQVFATTHSADCWQSLGRVADEIGKDASIAVHRVEREQTKATTFSASEISEAAKRDIEVR